jgi:hypothetical protein
MGCRRYRFAVEVKLGWLDLAPCEFFIQSTKVYGFLAASDPAIISAAQALNAIETCFLEPHEIAARPSRKMKPD